MTENRDESIRPAGKTPCRNRRAASAASSEGLADRRRARELEQRAAHRRGRLSPQMICDARDRYLETGELPADHPELAEIVVSLVEAVEAMWESVPGPPPEHEPVELLTESERDDAD